MDKKTGKANYHDAFRHDESRNTLNISSSFDIDGSYNQERSGPSIVQLCNGESSEGSCLGDFDEEQYHEEEVGEEGEQGAQEEQETDNLDSFAGEADYTDEDESQDGEPNLNNDTRAREYRDSILRDLVGQESGVRPGSNLLDVVQRLVGGLDASPFGRQLAEFEALISNLSQREDSFLVMESLNELSERLLMMNGITAERLIPANRLARSLTEILRDPTFQDHLELQLVACRCLFNFVEVNQDFINDALINGAVETLISHLFEITYIDLTEQALQALEMISRERCSHSLIVKNDGLLACLQNLDFLTVHAQRKSLAIVSNSCLHLNDGDFEKVGSCTEKLFDVAKNNSDKTVTENAWLALSRIVMSFRGKPELQESLFADVSFLGLVKETFTAACSSGTNDSTVGFRIGLSLLRSLQYMAATSTKLTELLIDISLGESLYCTLQSYAKEGESNTPESSSNGEPKLRAELSIDSIMAAPKDLVCEVLQVIGSILPANYALTDSPFVFLPDDKSSLMTNLNIAKAECLLKRQNEINAFVQWTWPILLKAFSASLDWDLRRMALINIFRSLMQINKELPIIKEQAEELSGVLASIISTSKAEFGSAQFEDLDDRITAHAGVQLLPSLAILNCIMSKEFLACSRSLETEGVYQDTELIARVFESSRPELKEASVPPHISNRLASISRFPPNNQDPEFSRTSEKVPKDLVLRRLGFFLASFQNCRIAFKTGSTDDDSIKTKHLKEIFQLSRSLEGLDRNDYEKLWLLLKDLLLSDSHPISSYELMSLGATELMISEFLKTDERDVFAAFSKDTFFSLIFSDFKASKKLIHLLLDSLLRLEVFNVVSATDRTASRDPIHTTNLARQFRIEISPCDKDSSEKPIIVYVQAIATFRSIESFLKQKALTSDSFDEVMHNDNTTDKEGEDILDFFVDDVYVPTDTTIFGAIFNSVQEKKDGLSHPDIWSRVHKVTYGRLKSSGNASENKVIPDVSTDHIVSHTTLSTLKLLKKFYGWNLMLRNRGLVSHPDDIFRSWKLTVKLKRQLEEILVVASGAQPPWSLVLTREYPFLFPLEIRILFLQSTSFGYSRLIHHWQATIERDPPVSTQGSDSLMATRKLQLGRISRQKVRIARSNFFPSALKLLEKFGSSPGILEIEYYDEVGSGLGSTLEFYSIVSHEFQERKLRMWLESDSEQHSNGYVRSDNGLFPRPLSNTEIHSKYGRKISYLFFCLGKFLARSLFDSRIVDLDLNPYLFDIIRYTEEPKRSAWKRSVTLDNLAEVDRRLSLSLRKLSELAKSARILDQPDLIEAMELYYLLPGNSDYELVPNGAQVKVTTDNVNNYIQLVIEAVLLHGVANQVTSLAEGFSTVFPVNSIKVFSSQELRQIFGAKEEDWSEATISEAIRANHGYTKASSTIMSLVKILSSLDQRSRRQFLQFLTGSPRLPLGGFKNLRPEFTVVKKEPEGQLKSDDYLPSVMTCALYLKLPDYSLIEIMESRLLRAIDDGANSFHLS